MELSPSRVVSLLVLASVVLITNCQVNFPAGRGQLEMTLRQLKSSYAEIADLKKALSDYQRRCPETVTTTTRKPPTPSTTTTRKPQTPSTTTTPKPPIPSTRKPPTTTTPKNTKMPLMPYDFDWGVSDQASGNMFRHTEMSGGQDVQGEYRVLLPDGRTQVVTFSAAPKTGYVAKVSYI